MADDRNEAGRGRGAAPDVAAALRREGYDIRGVLGLGGFGSVWEAERDGRVVAIKTVHHDQRSSCERLRAEITALGLIGPPHVPEVYGHGTLPNGSPYVVFERLTMPSLASRLGAPIEPAGAVALVTPVLAALGAAHARGVIHCDLKPANIFVSTSPPRGTLIDFGLARARSRDATLTLTESSDGMVLGTALYMAPEQCEARMDVDARADIYAMGVVLYQMLAGRTPFVGEPAEVRLAHLARRPPPLGRFAAVSEAMDQVVMACLAKAPEQRIPGAAELAAALEQALARPGMGRSVAAAGPALVPAGTGEQVMAGVVRFDSASPTARVRELLAEHGGLLCSVSGMRWVAVLGVDGLEPPVEPALRCARALLDQGVCERVIVDRERVRVHRSASGSVRVLSAALLGAARFPAPDDPPGILLTAAGASALAGVDAVAVAGTGGLFQVRGQGQAPGDADALIGRDRELEALVAGARAAARGRRPTIATVLGDAGQGKSHLGLAALAELAAERMRVIAIQVRELVGGDRERTLRALLRAALGLGDAPEVPADQGRALIAERLGAVGGEVWPAAALALGWLGADAPEVRALAAAPAALRAAFARAAGEALRNLAASGPVACLIDDAHRADDATLDALEYAALAEAGVPLWICVLGQPSLMHARPHWARRAAVSVVVELPPLAAGAAAALYRRLLAPAENVPRAVIARLVAGTQGSPLLITEVARAIKRQGLIRQHARGSAWYLAVDELDRLGDGLPRAEWLAERELGALPAELGAHARLCALLTSDVTADEVAGVLGELDRAGSGDAFPVDAWVATARLVERGLLVHHGGGRFGFRHDIVREQVARMVPAAVREAIHAAAYRYYRERAAVPAARRLALMAHHAAGCGAPEAGAMYLDLAERARQRHDYVEAELLYTRALEHLDPADTRALMRARNGRGLMRYRLSRFADALADLGRARELAAALGDALAQAEILLDEATALDWMRDFAASRERVEQARALTAGATTPLIDARLALGLGRACHRRGDGRAARVLLDGAAAAAELLGDAGYETHVIALMLLGWVLIDERDLGRAEEVFARSVALCEERGDTLHLAAVLNNRRELCLVQRDVAGAADDGLRARRIGREIGQISVEYATSYNLAELYYYAGDLDQARPYVLRAADIEPSCSAVPLARLLCARVLAVSGEVGGAAAMLAAVHAAEAEARQRGESEVLGECHAVLGAAVGLLCAIAGDVAWQALAARADAVAGPAERAELLELWALACEWQGRVADAADRVARALDIAAGAAHLIEGKLRRRLARLRG